FLPLIFCKLNPACNVIPNPSHQDSLSKWTCRNLCQKGRISYKGHSLAISHLLYLTLSTVQKTHWTERAGGHLTSITSANENTFLRKLAQGQKEVQFWMGATYQKASGSFFKWSDGSLTNFIQKPLLSFFRAVGGLVNSLFNINICLTLSRSEWDQSPCRKRLPFICIYKPKLSQPQSVTE
ncbi:MRC2 protein, partial [Lophotis ruficrista]|nr:MRC2 protein [Lophotis ruficrista]